MNKRKVVGIVLIVAAVPLVLAAFWTLFMAYFMFGGGPCPNPNTIGEARVYSMIAGLIGLALLASGVVAGKTGLSLSKPKRESNKAAGG